MEILATGTALLVLVIVAGVAYLTRAFAVSQILRNPAVALAALLGRNTVQAGGWGFVANLSALVFYAASGTGVLSLVLNIIRFAKH